MVSFTYPAYLPIAILLGSGVLAFGFHAYVRPWLLSHALSRRFCCLGAQVFCRLRPEAMLGLGLFLYTGAFTTLLLLRHRAFTTFALDLGIFVQATWLLAHGKTPFVTLRGLHAFGDHSSFILLLVAPLYRIFDTPTTLFILESAAVAIGALPLYWLSRDRLPGRWLPLLVPFLYLLSPSTEYVNAFEFHPEALAMPLVLFAFYFGLKGRNVLFAVCAVLAASCKEDVALTLFAMGLFFAWRGRVRFGLTTAALALCWFVLDFLVILPYFSGANVLYASLFTSSATADPGPPVTSLPITVLRRMLQPVNLEYIVLLLVPFGGISLFGWPSLLIAAPALLINLLSARPSTHTIFYQYAAMVTPWLAVSAIEGLHRFHTAWASRIADRPPQVAHRRSLGLRWLGGLRRLPWSVSGIGLYMLLTGLLSHYCFSPSLLSLQFVHDVQTLRGDHYYRSTLRALISGSERDALVKDALNAVPPNASVAAQSIFTPHLAHREEIYQLPLPYRNTLQPDELLSIWAQPGQDSPQAVVDYILLDSERDATPMTPVHTYLVLIRLLNDPDYQLQIDQDGVRLFRRKGVDP